MSKGKMMIKGDQNKQIFCGLTENHHYFYCLTEQQPKQALTEYTEEQLQSPQGHRIIERLNKTVGHALQSNLRPTVALKQPVRC